jgi:hypothetical protein
MSKFSEAAFALMKRRAVTSISSGDLWRGLCESEPELTVVTPTRKTPRTTAMRDLRKDRRFVIGGGTISLADILPKS